MKNFKILIIDNSVAFTGALHSILSATNLLPTFTIYWALPSSLLVEQLRNRGKNAFYIPFLEIQKNLNFLLYLPILFLNIFKILRFCRKKDVPIIHVNDIYNMSGVVVKLFKPSIKLIYHVRLLPNSYAAPLYKLWVRLILRYSDKILCVSKVVFDSLPKSPKKHLVYDALPLPQPINVKPVSQFTFLYVGNYISGKGQNWALEAFALSGLARKEAQLIMVGGSMGKAKNKKYKQSLQDQIESLNLVNHTCLHGFSDNMRDYYAQADVVLNFSESESFSMVCLEALLYGIPVVATRCGGPEELVDEGVNGLLVDNKSVPQMAEALVTIFENNELRSSMNKNAPLISMKFSIEESVNKLNEIYQNL